jgi:hypothetical protein
VTNSDQTEMPWGGSLKRTAQVAAVALVSFTGLCAAELQRQRREKEESESSDGPTRTGGSEQRQVGPAVSPATEAAASGGIPRLLRT